MNSYFEWFPVQSDFKNYDHESHYWANKRRILADPSRESWPFARKDFTGLGDRQWPVFLLNQNLHPDRIPFFLLSRPSYRIRDQNYRVYAICRLKGSIWYCLISSQRTYVYAVRTLTWPASAIACCGLMICQLNKKKLMVVPSNNTIPTRTMNREL